MDTKPNSESVYTVYWKGTRTLQHGWNNADMIMRFMDRVPTTTFRIKHFRGVREPSVLVDEALLSFYKHGEPKVLVGYIPYDVPALCDCHLIDVIFLRPPLNPDDHVTAAHEVSLLYRCDFLFLNSTPVEDSSRLDYLVYSAESHGIPILEDISNLVAWVEAKRTPKYMVSHILDKECNKI